MRNIINCKFLHNKNTDKFYERYKQNILYSGLKIKVNVTLITMNGKCGKVIMLLC